MARSPSPPPGARWALGEMPFDFSEAEAESVLESVPHLTCCREARDLAVALSADANEWLKSAEAFTLDGVPKGAPPSDRAQFCRGVAARAEELLAVLGAPDTRFPVGVGCGPHGVTVQLDPHTGLSMGLANLIGLSGVYFPEPRSPEDESLLGLAWDVGNLGQALGAPPPELWGRNALGDQVMGAAVAAVALLRDYARLSAVGWERRSKQDGKPFGGRPGTPGRFCAAVRLARTFEWAFGLNEGQWKNPGVRKQAVSYEDFADFLVGFAREVEKAADVKGALHRFGGDGPWQLNASGARRLAEKVAAFQRDRKRPPGAETSPG